MLCAGAAHAAEPVPKQKLEACLKKAGEYPDMAAADADGWSKHGGGEYARLCKASAQFNMGEFEEAAGAFRDLAGLHENNDSHHAAELYARAGLAYMRAHDEKSAEASYGKAVKLEPDDPEFWTDRATGRAEDERYWDAISDFNRSLALMPDQSDVLRMRGQAWIKLGNDKNAERDFIAAEQIDQNESSPPLEGGARGGVQ